MFYRQFVVSSCAVTVNFDWRLFTDSVGGSRSMRHYAKAFQNGGSGFGYSEGANQPSKISNENKAGNMLADYALRQ